MTHVKQHDFVEIDYIGKLKEDNSVFDTTDKEVAKKNGLEDKDVNYGPVIVCVGHSHMMKPFEESLVGREIGKSYSIEVDAENAFGKKDARLLQMIPANKFKQQKIQPFPGLQINVDGMFGIVKTVSGGRCYVDFNHPLAGKDVIYEIKVHKIITDTKEKLSSFLESHLHSKDFDLHLENGAASVAFKHELPKDMVSHLEEETAKAIPEVKSLIFTVKGQK